MAINVLAVSVDGSDIIRLAEFWAEVLGQPVSPGATDGFAAIAIPDGLRLSFHHVPERKVVKNRVHLDLNIGGPRTDPPGDRRRRIDAEVGRLVQRGARQSRSVQELGGYFVNMFDPEGNEFDVH